MDAHAGALQAQPVRERGVEVLDEDRPDVVPHPLVEDRAEEVAVRRGLDGVGEELAVVAVDDRDQLDEVRVEVVAQEAVDVGAVVLVGAVHRHQRVPLHPVPLQRGEAGHDPVEGRLAAPVDAVGVVELARAVDGDPHQEVVLPEELRPVVVEQRGVGLQGVAHHLARPGVPTLELDDPAVEVQTHHGRLAPLEGEDRLGLVPVRVEQLDDVLLEDVVGHPEARARVELLLRQVEAVGAVEVAHRAGRLGHDVEGAARGPRGSTCHGCPPPR